MSIESKVRNKLKKHFNRIWEGFLNDAKRIVETQLKEYNPIVSYEHKAEFREYDYSEDITYRYSWKIEDPDKKIFSNHWELGKKLNEVLKPQRPEFTYFDSGTYSKPYIYLYFKMELDYKEVRDLAKQFEKEVQESVNKYKSIQHTKQVLEEENLLKLTKPQALQKAVEDLLDSTAHYNKIHKSDSLEQLKNDSFYNNYIRPIVELIAVKWGISSDELEQATFKGKETFSSEQEYCPIHGKLKEDKIEAKLDVTGLVNICTKCRSELVTEKSYKEHLNKEKFKDVIIKTTLSRLPRFIYPIVRDVKVIFKDKARGQTESGHYAPLSNSITIRWSSYGDLKEYMAILAHEYWHAFERKSGFKANMQDIFEETVRKVSLGDLGKNAIEDFKTVIQTLTYFGKEDFSEILKMFHSSWGRKYFEKQHSTIAEDLQQIQQSVQDTNLYITINEVLAETLAEIVAQKPGRKIPQSLIVWMNKKFSYKNHFIKSEKIINEVLRESLMAVNGNQR